MGVIDLTSELTGDMFAPLLAPELFATAYQHPEMRTVAWANCADLAPEFLLDLLHGRLQQAASLNKLLPSPLLLPNGCLYPIT